MFVLDEKFYVGRQALLRSKEMLGMRKPSASLERLQGYPISNVKIALKNFVVTLLIFKVVLFSHS